MMNSVVLVGRAGRDAELKWFESGRAKASFTLAVDRPGRRSMDNQDQTDWFRIEMWGKVAEIAGEYVKKGKQVGIVGRLEISRWTDAQGQKVESPVIVADDMRLLGGRGEGEGFGGGQRSGGGGYGGGGGSSYGGGGGGQGGGYGGSQYGGDPF